MPEELTTLFTAGVWWSYLFRIGLYFLAAGLFHRLSSRLARRLLRLSQFSSRQRLRPDRYKTLRSLIGSSISFVAFVLAFLLSLSLFVDLDTLIWMVGLFSAAFGLGARPLISDFLTGVGFLFEDPYDVGEKVELLGVEGIVETVNLRTTTLRAPSGELYVVPNGEVRVIRNFSRGLFSSASISLKIAASDLNEAIPLLEELGQEAVMLLPNLLEPWQVVSETGAMGQQTELTLATKARFGQGAEMRPRLLALVQERLNAANIELVS